MSIEHARAIVDLFRPDISPTFEVQSVNDGDTRVWVSRTHEGYAVFDAPISSAPAVSAPPSLVAPAVDGSRLADAIVEADRRKISLAQALAGDCIVPTEGWPLTVFARANLKGGSGLLVLASGLDFFGGPIPLKPIHVAAQGRGGFQAVRVKTETVLSGLRDGRDLFEAVFEAQPGAMSVLAPFYPNEVSALEAAFQLRLAVPLSKSAPKGPARL